MAFDLSSISSGTRIRAPRVVLLGVEKIGKSTFAAGSDRPVFVPIKGEEGIDSLDVAQFPTCNSVADVTSCLYALYQEQHDFGTVVVDSASALEPLVWADVCQREKAASIEKVGGGYGKGYTEAVGVWRQLTEALDALRSSRNMASILIGHVKVKAFQDPITGSYDTWTFDLNAQAAAMLFRWADAILFANTKVVVKSEDAGFNQKEKRGIDTAAGQRFLYTRKTPAHPGGGRGLWGRLPYELPLSWAHLQDALAAAAQQSS